MRLSGVALLYIGGIISGIYLQQNYRGLPNVATIYREWSEKFRRVEQEHRLKH